MQEELIQQFQNGNRQAGDDFYKANLGLVYAIAKQNRKMLNDEEETLAIVNQAFAYSLKNVDLEKAKFSTYFAITARGMILSHYRNCERTIRTQRRDMASKKIVFCDSLDTVIYASDTEDITIAHTIGSHEDFTNVCVDEALNKLNKKDREAFKLQLFNELSQTQIAKILNSSQVEISRRIRRAKASLKVILKDAC